MPRNKPAYLSIYETLRDGILDGAYPHGSRLPSKRDLASQNGVSVITVEHALALLSEEGYIETRERSGSFVLYQTGDTFLEGQALQIQEPLPALSAVSHSALPELPVSVYARTVRHVLSEYGEAVLSRSPGEGIYELRSAIARYLGRSRGIKVLPEQIVVGSGAEALYGRIVQIFGRTRMVAIEKPSYEKIEQVYRANDVHLEYLPLGSDGIQSAALQKSKARILHISPYRSFPSGVTASAGKKREYYAWAKEHDAYLIEDDFESEFNLSGKPVETVLSLDTEGRVLYLNTFSQTVSPAVRVGYLVLPEPLLSRARERTGFYACSVPTLDQYVLATLLDSGEFERHVNRVRRSLRKDRENRG